MLMRIADRARIAALAAVACLGLTGCADSNALWGPSTPRNGGGEAVDPQTGIPLPGAPGGGRGGGGGGGGM
jgi:hypothetical protein